ncbi:MAG TPA: ribonuclease HII [Candidatus Pacearchaeota archaeon]|nr:ribonuclease HII [Candidatus Pacearchaeota archaeon]
MLKIGVDEAGKGPVVGPMVVAGCLIESDCEKELKELGVKDSKKLSQKQREALEKEIKKRAFAFETRKVYPEEIDRKNQEGVNLNELESRVITEVILKLVDSEKIKDNPKISRDSKIQIVIDCPSAGIEKWQNQLVEKLVQKKVNVKNLSFVCENKADTNHVVVSAASILAKCVREKEMDILKEKYPGIGSGYPSDPNTKKFLQENIKKYNNHGIFRKSWETWKTAWESQSRLAL